MYITYDRPYRWEITDENTEPSTQQQCHDNAEDDDDDQSDSMSLDDTTLQNGNMHTSSFRPTWLVRTSDMNIVPGYTVNGPYYTLSYSWNQSGTITKIGSEYHRDDLGNHKIIYEEEESVHEEEEEDYIGYHQHIQQRERQQRVVLKARYVSFVQLIQQLCVDCDIDYIWYDQLCIDQNDPNEKRREMQHMDLIYRHSYCTVALVPELHTCDGRANLSAIINSEWANRMWTLEEAYMANQILFIGTNVHLWSHTIAQSSTYKRDTTLMFLRSICDKSQQQRLWNAGTILCHAHARSSTRPHDKIFALAKMSSRDTITSSSNAIIRFDYNQPLLELILQFYELLAQNDPTILCFGAPLSKNIFPSESWLITPQLEEEEDHLKNLDRLPSWAGIHGKHLAQPWGQHDDTVGIASSAALLASSGYSVEGARIYLYDCSYIPIKFTSILQNWHGSSDQDAAYDDRTSNNNSSSLAFAATADILQAHFGSPAFPVHACGLKVTHSIVSESTTTRHVYLSLVGDDDCFQEHAILSGIRIGLQQHCNTARAIGMPVVRQNYHGESWKSVGLCIVIYNVNVLDPIIKEAELMDFIIE
ncbi:hypothetical protein BDB00DRAFT_877074 [Zychaea mexicana]|uniref:uncharacterized protein n=1 Tax=Zychaea mexicana TaxID=64656 RepID=UPI0022FE97CD|nr:uncharacterized protein BDB00DRAFT_877074 [Zychaea mexicana]KAI9488805.1 hypothetical protein BDB00DRAFT_877074 [Zychaea mexicana]